VGIKIRGVGGSPTSAVLMTVDGQPQFVGIYSHHVADFYKTEYVDSVIPFFSFLCVVGVFLQLIGMKLKVFFLLPFYFCVVNKRKYEKYRKYENIRTLDRYLRIIGFVYGITCTD